MSTKIKIIFAQKYMGCANQSILCHLQSELYQMLNSYINQEIFLKLVVSSILYSV